MANVLTVMSRQPNIADTIAEAYGKIISSASEDEKEILFESLLLDITLTDSIAVDALVKCGII